MINAKVRLRTGSLGQVSYSTCGIEMGPVRSQTSEVFYTSLRRALWASVSCAIDRFEHRRPIMEMPRNARRHPLVRSAVAGRTNRLSVDFLQIDSEIGLTFSGIALDASDSEKKNRMTQSARRAYDTIARLRANVELSQAEGDKLDINLQRLKSELQHLGERF